MLQFGVSRDKIAGGEGNLAFARAGGWPQLIPYATDAGTEKVEAPYVGTAFIEYDDDDHLSVSDPENPIGKSIVAQMQHYLTTYLETGEGELIWPEGFL